MNNHHDHHGPRSWRPIAIVFIIDIVIVAAAIYWLCNK